MAKFWAKRINYDLNRIGEVPSLWREQVRELIGQTGDGAGSATDGA